jgi:hypothetical protein
MGGRFVVQFFLAVAYTSVYTSLSLQNLIL